MTPSNPSKILGRLIDRDGTAYRLIYTYGGTISILAKPPGAAKFTTLRTTAKTPGHLPELLDAWFHLMAD